MKKQVVVKAKKKALKKDTVIVPKLIKKVIKETEYAESLEEVSEKLDI